MATLILTQREVRELLPMRACIDLVADALAALARGEGKNPLRRGMRLPDGRSVLATMPGALTARSGPSAVGLKVVSVFPGNRGTPFDEHQGVVVLLDPSTGAPRAILDASEVTSIRTAAASAVATRLLARPDARELALLGAGIEARKHLEAMLCVRPIERVRVFSRDRARREAFAARESERRGVRVEAASSAREAVEGAAIVCTVTTSAVPVLEGAWLAPGTHVNAVGACAPAARELDSAAVARARIFVDRRESALAESGDLRLARAEGAIGDDAIVAEIGELLIGIGEGRRAPEEVTLFESLGIAVEDLAAAAYLDRRARELGVGTLVELGGTRDEG